MLVSKSGYSVCQDKQNHVIYVSFPGGSSDRCLTEDEEAMVLLLVKQLYEKGENDES